MKSKLIELTDESKLEVKVKVLIIGSCTRTGI